MRAVRVRGSSPRPELILSSAAKPEPLEGELLIQVSAAAVTPTELFWYPTLHTKGGAAREHAIPGHEFSGVIAAVGPGVNEWQVGQTVFGMNDWFWDGAMAEYCTAPASAVCLKPGVSHVEAATVPISALTAWQGLFGKAKLQPGDRVLVHGGAGAVGSFVVQLARLHGANVVATASDANLAFVNSLGAQEVIDYQKQAFEQTVPPVDIVFDTVGGETLHRSWSLLKPGGRMVTIAAGEEAATDERTKAAFLLVQSDGRQLAEIAHLLDAGKIRTFVDAVVPLSQAPEAFAGKVARQGHGKVVVAVEERLKGEIL